MGIKRTTELTTVVLFVFIIASFGDFKGPGTASDFSEGTIL